MMLILIELRGYCRLNAALQFKLNEAYRTSNAIQGFKEESQTIEQYYSMKQLYAIVKR